jgi:alpha/beta superfamily hydrolase
LIHPIFGSLGFGYLGSTARGKNSPYSTLSDVCSIVLIVHKMSHSGGSNQQKVSEMLLTSMSNHTRMLFKDDFSGGFFVSFPQGMRHIGCSGGENKQD